MTQDEYEVLIPPVHRYPREEGAERSRFAEYVRLLVEQGVHYWELLDSYKYEFSLDFTEIGAARGRQLDIIGAIVGASRQLPFEAVGFSGLLGDDDFRLLIKARIAQNRWDGTNGNLVELMQNVFQGYDFTFEDLAVTTPTKTVEVDGHMQEVSNVMHMLYKIKGSFSDIQKQMIRGDLIVPRPAGVFVEYDIIDTVSAMDVPTDSALGGDYAKSQMKDEPV